MMMLRRLLTSPRAEDITGKGEQNSQKWEQI